MELVRIAISQRGASRPNFYQGVFVRRDCKTSRRIGSSHYFSRGRAFNLLLLLRSPCGNLLRVSTFLYTCHGTALMFGAPEFGNVMGQRSVSE
jgi:hypothetical protein